MSTHRSLVLAATVGLVAASPAAAQQGCEIVQITDTHLGAFMPVERLRAVCARAVECDPDLVLLTGDFLTMESQSDPGVLAAALKREGRLHLETY